MITDLARLQLGDGFEMQCDKCGDVEFFDTEEFKEMLDESKAIGWRGFKSADGMWEHRCPACADRGSELSNEVRSSIEEYKRKKKEGGV